MSVSFPSVWSLAPLSRPAAGIASVGIPSASPGDTSAARGSALGTSTDASAVPPEGRCVGTPSETKPEGNQMKIVVIGGTGLIGSKLVQKLRADGHDPLAASPATGVDIITGKGLSEALAGAQVVVDVSNAPNWGDAEVMDFFQTSARTIASAETAAGIGHHVALSVVGTDLLQGSGYFRAKLAQEEAIKAAPIPSTILRATQFFEFSRSTAKAATPVRT